MTQLNQSTVENTEFVQKRGQLTDRIKKKSKELLGYEITQKELRLMPYILTVMMNEQKIDPNKIDQEEREILGKWQEDKYIEGGMSGLRINGGFWQIICTLVMLGYVDLSS